MFYDFAIIDDTGRCYLEMARCSNMLSLLPHFRLAHLSPRIEFYIEEHGEVAA